MRRLILGSRVGALLLPWWFWALRRSRPASAYRPPRPGKREEKPGEREWGPAGSGGGQGGDEVGGDGNKKCH